MLLKSGRSQTNALRNADPRAIPQARGAARATLLAARAKRRRRTGGITFRDYIGPFRVR
jgi:hypothetical protein